MPARRSVVRQRDVDRGAELHAADLQAGARQPIERRRRDPRTRPRSGSSRSRPARARGGRAAASAGAMPSAAAQRAAPPTGSSDCSKKSMVSSLVSSRQSGSGSMSRWRMGAAFLARTGAALPRCARRCRSSWPARSASPARIQPCTTAAPSRYAAVQSFGQQALQDVRSGRACSRTRSSSRQSGA